MSLPPLSLDYFPNDREHRRFWWAGLAATPPAGPGVQPLHYPANPRPIPPAYLARAPPLEFFPQGHNPRRASPPAQLLPRPLAPLLCPPLRGPPPPPPPVRYDPPPGPPPGWPFALQGQPAGILQQPAGILQRPAAEPGDAREGEAHFDVIVPVGPPLGRGVAAQTEVIRVPGNVEPGDLLDRSCAKMNLHPSRATLGYKISNQRDAVVILRDVQAMQRAIEKFLAARARARVANRASVTLNIQNLGPPELPSAAVQQRRGTKRPGGAISLVSDPLDTTYDFPHVPNYYTCLDKLKSDLRCTDIKCNPGHDERHWCFRNKHGQLKPVTMRWLSLWAKFMAKDPESVDAKRPPHTAGFEFLQRKPTEVMQRKGPRGQGEPVAPNVTVNNYIGAAASIDSPVNSNILRPSKRINTGAQVTDLTGSDSDDDVSSDLPIRVFLQILDSESPGHDFGAFGETLAVNGITRVVHILAVDTSLFIHLIDMSPDAATILVARAKKQLAPKPPKATSSRVTVEDLDKENVF
ncbi:hypothetical protein EXIGLDRAFT_778120 [Exidia glandulosa HHB12029]|uniref:Uncharacterized protein n=1 Tax=Exidia glandulosa HHB12029 TaxID=1314781 RepID=A0A165CPM8_EXIGL|nr:hypothetical protein EXIGLDRAFT_778120 [Exidia glandulosa HHB12029]